MSAAIAASRPGEGAAAISTSSRRGRELDPENKDKTLYVGNLDRRVTEYHLMQLFHQFGDLTRVQFMWHHHGELKGQPRGFAFVEFRERDAAAAAVEQANGVELAGRKMNVRFAQEKDPDEGALKVDFKSTAERRSAAVGARMSSFGGGRGGGRGGFRGGDDARFNKFAYVPAPLPTSGFRQAGATSSALRTALDKIRAIEDRLAEEDEQRAFERREAARKQIAVDSITRPATAAAATQARQQPRQDGSGREDYAQRSGRSGGDDSRQRDGRSPPRSGYVHPDRQRMRSRSRSRSPRGQRDGYSRR